MSWTCVRCETVNPVTVDICEVCDTKRSPGIKTASKAKKRSAIKTDSKTEPTPRPSNSASVFTFIFGLASLILFFMYIGQDQELKSMRVQPNDAQVNIDSAVATAESNVRASVLGLNYYRVTLSDFYNSKTYPINNLNGEQIGDLYVTYGWSYMENDKPIDSKSLVTVRVIFNIYNESTNGYYGFATQLDDRYDVEERHLPTIGSTYTAETTNYKMAVRVIEFKENQDDYGFNELVVDVVMSNK